jgi:hypothetical protein
MISLINQDHISNFNSKQLKSILDNEIRLGNEINETAKDWPYKNGIAIFLKRPFSQHYHCFPGIEFVETNDPHYWKAHYFDTTTNDLIACPFGNYIFKRRVV